MSGWIDTVKDFIRGHPDAPDVEPIGPDAPLAEYGGDAESAPVEPDAPDPTGTPDVTDHPTDPGDAGAIPRDPPPEPGHDQPVVGDDEQVQGSGLG
jgi:hypothetical protein